MLFFENWYIIAAAIAIIVVAAEYVINGFLKLPREGKIAKVKEWLLWAVTQAEKELGGGTGQLKLRYVYDMFVTKFPGVAKYLSFETFSKLVDEALEKMNHLLENNINVKGYIEGDK